MNGSPPPSASTLPAADFRRRLARWYRHSARKLPWRGIDDPYATWLSEVMLQQTRVATVIDRYTEFLHRFPTLQSLAAAPETDVLALWSGLGYYRRARMLHRGAQFVVAHLGGVMPRSAAALLALPGIGAYTSAAIASIAFAEPIAVLDGNVERVLLRVLGQPEDKSSAARSRLTATAQSLIPTRSPAGQNAPGDHNQAMMELGATICLPRAPLCLHCPVMELCRTRGEHPTAKRSAMNHRRVAHLLAIRTRAAVTEVLLERRDSAASLMPSMFELPPLPLDAVENLAPILHVKHAITNTNYQVDIFSAAPLRKQIPAADSMLQWIAVNKLNDVPLTGLARKVLVKAGLLAQRNGMLAKPK